MIDPLWPVNVRIHFRDCSARNDGSNYNYIVHYDLLGMSDAARVGGGTTVFIHRLTSRTAALVIPSPFPKPSPPIVRHYPRISFRKIYRPEYKRRTLEYCSNHITVLSDNKTRDVVVPGRDAGVRKPRPGIWHVDIWCFELHSCLPTCPQPPLDQALPSAHNILIYCTITGGGSVIPGRQVITPTPSPVPSSRSQGPQQIVVSTHTRCYCANTNTGSPYCSWHVCWGTVDQVLL
ncbi:hypothetical protein J6590_072397 [Homalodisca vitripennis]|nr:hypothetical protein J6590_072397 [Homalodisca vitripennis]